MKHRTLEYGRLRRRARWRSVLLAVVVGLITWGGFRYAGDVSRHWQQRRLYQECAIHRLPENVIVYETQPNAATKLNPFDGVPALVPRTPQPQALLVGDIADCWSHLAPQVGSGASRGATLFLHERVSPSGSRRLVVVESGDNLFYWQFADADVSKLRVTVIPSPKLGDRHMTDSRVSIPDIVAVGPVPKVTLFAGQPDSTDESHFSIPFDFDGQRGVLDGWLRDNNVVHIERRKDGVRDQVRNVSWNGVDFASP